MQVKITPSGHEQYAVWRGGTHDDLVNHGGIYQRLHELQYLEADPIVGA